MTLVAEHFSGEGEMSVPPVAGHVVCLYKVFDCSPCISPRKLLKVSRKVSTHAIVTPGKVIAPKRRHPNTHACTLPKFLLE